MVEAGRSKEDYQSASLFMLFGIFFCNLLFMLFGRLFCNLQAIREAGSMVSGSRIPCLLGKSLLSVYRASTDSLLAGSAKNPRYDLINLFY